MALFKLDWNPTRPQLRVFGYCATAFAVLFAIRFRQSPTTTGLSATIAAVFAAFAALAPQLLRWPYLVASIVTAPIGWALGHVVLSVIYFGLFTGLGLVFRLMGRDSLQLRMSPDADTYWQRRAPSRPAADYLRQF
ncbi:MAG: hypothetical protein K1X57_04235 [Gemmataceae bacterium]|nr:hypothetical protein [Gemmataceae bacterium]